MMISLFPPKFEDYHTYKDNKHQNKLSKEQDMVHVHMYKKANNELKLIRFVTNLTKFSLESDRFPTMQTEFMNVQVDIIQIMLAKVCYLVG